MTDSSAFEHIYKTMPDGQEQRKGYHKMRNTWHTLRIFVIRVFSFYGVMNRWKLKQYSATVTVGRMKQGSMSAKFQLQQDYYCDVHECSVCELRASQELTNTEDHGDEDRIIGKIIHKDSAHSEVLLSADVTIDLYARLDFPPSAQGRVLPCVLQEHKSRRDRPYPRDPLHLHQYQRENGEPDEHGGEYENHPPRQSQKAISVKNSILDGFHDRLQRFEDEWHLVEIVRIEVDETQLHGRIHTNLSSFSLIPQLVFRSNEKQGPRTTAILLIRIIIKSTKVLCQSNGDDEEHLPQYQILRHTSVMPRIIGLLLIVPLQPIMPIGDTHSRAYRHHSSPYLHDTLADAHLWVHWLHRHHDVVLLQLREELVGEAVDDHDVP